MCSICTTVCPNFANRCYEIIPCSLPLQKAVRSENGEIVLADDGTFEIKQKYQILNIANFCNECGNCNTFCPASGAPYRDKPKFYLTISSFNQAEEGYYLAALKDKKNLIYKQNDNIVTLSGTQDEFIFETDYVTAKFSRRGFIMSDVQFRTPCVNEAHFHKAAEMAVLLQGAENLLDV
jgi:putative selenate reductase